MQKPTVPNICPECGHHFRGKGFDGIDAHWRARHEQIMPYSEAWPLIRSGAYSRQTGSIEGFFGCLETKGGPKLTIDEINEITARAWAGER
ncbi:MAG: hypothetical protein ABR898_13875 [Terracidiphilus sp.]|jgi:hypothetical protein